MSVTATSAAQATPSIPGLAVSPEVLAFDAGRAEAFAGQVITTLNGGFVSLLLSAGHRLGLFDTLANLPPSTSEEVARASGLSERYVREWLNGLTAARYIEFDRGSETYYLPQEHAAFLTTAAGSNNLAYFSQYAALLAGVEDRVIESFRTGGGVPYGAFGRFQELMEGESRPVVDNTLQSTLPGVPGLVERLAAGIDVADIGCGSGHAIKVMARAFPKSKFTGYDISAEGIAAGRAEAEAWSLPNARFVQIDVANLCSREAFDLITAFDAIHDQVAPRVVLKNIRRALRPDGTFLMVDIASSSKVEENFDRPLAPALYTISLMHCMTVSLAHGGEGLGTMWGYQMAQELLAEAGFTSVEVREVEGDAFNLYYTCRV